MFDFISRKIVYRKTVTTTTADGKTVKEEATITDGDAAKAAAEADKMVSRLDKFFAKMDEAFKEL